jgi:hypothetical protein
LSPDDRRSRPRRLFATSGSNPVVATIGVVPRAAFLCDLGPGGVALLTTDPPAVGSVVPVWLALPVGAPSQIVLLRVVYAQAQGPDLHRLGLCGVDEASCAALLDLAEAVNGDADGK